MLIQPSVLTLKTCFLTATPGRECFITNSYRCRKIIFEDDRAYITLIIIHLKQITMKKILLLMMVGLLSNQLVKAQSPDYGFETWVDLFGVSNPTGWTSLNILKVAANMEQTVYKETTAPYVGSAAVKIVSKQIKGTTVPGIDTAGVLLLGDLDVVTKKIIYGKPFKDHPSSFTFATKYQPVGTDTANVLIELSKFDSVSKKSITLAAGLFTQHIASTTWTNQLLNLVYNPLYLGQSPDTLKILASSSGSYYQRLNSTFFIDAISWMGTVSTSDFAGVKNSVSVYPAPAREQVTFNCSAAASAVQIMDVTGRTVGIFPMENNNVTLETGNYTSGLYIYTVLDNQKQVLNKGKFEVIK